MIAWTRTLSCVRTTREFLRLKGLKRRRKQKLVSQADGESIRETITQIEGHRCLQIAQPMKTPDPDKHHSLRLYTPERLHRPAAKKHIKI